MPAITLVSLHAVLGVRCRALICYGSRIELSTTSLLIRVTTLVRQRKQQKRRDEDALKKTEQQLHDGCEAARLLDVT